MAPRTLADCFAILGLRTTASREDVLREFRRLAKQYHPDIHRTPTAAAHFVEILGAYKRLQAHFGPHRGGWQEDMCPQCGLIDELFVGADGRRACVDCLFGRTSLRRFLPFPLIVMVRHVLEIGLIAATCVLGVASIVTGSLAQAVAALATAGAAFVVLAIRCLLVKYVW